METSNHRTRYLVATSALSHLHLLGLDTPAWVSAFAFDLDAARKVTTSHLLQTLRPSLDVAFRNRSFFAAEAIEGIVLQLFLLEVRKRCYAPSIIWTHATLVKPTVRSE